jgi:hypothetical protein
LFQKACVTKTFEEKTSCCAFQAFKVLGFRLYKVLHVIPQGIVFLPKVVPRRKIVPQGDICYVSPWNYFLPKAMPGRKTIPWGDICYVALRNCFLHKATLD